MSEGSPEGLSPHFLTPPSMGRFPVIVRGPGLAQEVGKISPDAF